MSLLSRIEALDNQGKDEREIAKVTLPARVDTGMLGLLAAILDRPIPGAWATDAPCSQSDPDLWWPEHGQVPRDAERICSTCSTCPVRLECLTHAEAVGEQYGVWGGESAHTRTRKGDRTAS